ncbi:MAG: hypothetical protein ABL951_02545 [Alphaproteobacteria bacterium]
MAGFILGGALEGIGKGIATAAEETGKEMRERARLELVDRMNDENAAVEREYKTGERISTQGFTTAEREGRQGYESGENKLTRDATAGENRLNRQATSSENSLNRQHDIRVDLLRNAHDKAMAEGNHERAKEIRAIALKDDIALNVLDANLDERGRNYGSERERADARIERERVAGEASSAVEEATKTVAGKSWLPSAITDRFTDFTEDEIARGYASLVLDARDAGRPTPPFDRSEIENTLRTRKDTTAGGATTARANLTSETDRLESAQQQLRDTRNPPPPPPPQSQRDRSSGRMSAALRRSLDSGEYTDAKQVGERIQVKKRGDDRWYWYDE